MAGHTLGPWRLSAGDETTVFRDGTLIARAICGGPYGLKLIEAESNARLIAAAPELLEAARLALETAENWIHDQLDGTGMVDDELAKLEPVRAAIAKATGA